MKKEDVTPYLDEFYALKKEFQDKIELYIGLEIDYLDEESNPSIDYFRNLPLDYRIGSVHLLKDDQGEVVDIDCSKENFKEKLEKHFHNDVKSTSLAYFSKLMSMVELGGFDIVGHVYFVCGVLGFGSLLEIKRWYNYFRNPFCNSLFYSTSTNILFIICPFIHYLFLGRNDSIPTD